MHNSSEKLEHFQISLSSKGQAQVTPEVTDDVLGSLSYLDDINISKMARQTDIHRQTMNDYVRGKASPNIKKFTRILKKLGYDLYIVKNDSVQ